MSIINYSINFLTDQSFDLPDRTFHSLQTSWRLASRESTTDVKELIPEFFFLPEFFMNAEGKHSLCIGNKSLVACIIISS